MYKIFFKRFIDFIISLCALILFCPVLLIVSIWLYIVNRGSGVFFRQNRLGKDGKIFVIVKFKSMNDKKDQNGNLLPDKFRLTKIGTLIRKTSIDELPQLFNVLKGNMSLIGPRPLLPEYLSLYNKIQVRRNEVKPGITGWAQVNGRNAISWEKKFDLDVWYVDNVSFLVDIKILFLSIIKVLKKEGVNLNEEVSALPFNGNN